MMKARTLARFRWLAAALALAGAAHAQTLTETRLTSGSTDRNPTWSSDGSRIHFESDRGPGVWSVPALGGAIAPSSLVYLDEKPDRNRAPSPDGAWIATSVDGDLWVEPSSGGMRVRVTGGPPVDTEPAWSPAGFRLAFVRDGEIHAIQLAQVDLTVAKSVDDPVPNEGDTVVFTITVTNQGPDGATGVNVTDLLPGGVSFVSSGATQGAYDDSSGLWTIGALANGASATLDVTATVDAGTAGNAIQNLAGLTSADQVDVDPTNNSGDAVITVQAVDLAVSKSVDDPGPNQGDTITYAVTVTNAGPDGATGVVVTDFLPTGVTFASDSTTQGDYDEVSGLWAVGSVASGGSASLFLSATVDGGTGGAVIQNSVAVTASDQTDTNAANDADTADILVETADLAVTKTVDDANPNQGDTITFTVTVSNLGPDAAAGIEVTDMLPSGLTYSGDVLTQGTYASGTGVWSVGALAVSDSATLELSATVDPGNPGAAIQNSVAVTGSDHLDPNGSNDSDTADILIQSADIFVTKMVNDSAPNEGDQLTFTVTATNQGPDAVSVLQVTDLIPSGITYQSAILDHGSYNDLTGVWDVGPLAVSEVATLNLFANVDGGTAGTTIVNTAVRTLSDPDDANAANDTANASVTVQAADLAVAKSVDDPMPNENDTVVYAVTVTNLGPDAASGIEVTDILPAEVTYQSDSASQGDYDEITGVWDLGALGASVVATLEITVVVGPGTAGQTITNTAAVTASDQTDPNSANDSSSADMTVGAIDLSVMKSADLPAPNEGATVTYTIALTNLGPDEATGVEVTDILPTGVTYVSNLPSQGSYAPGTGVWTAGSLASAASASLDVTVTVDAGTAGSTIQNAASVTASDQVDTNPANDADTADIVVQAIDIEVTKDVDNSTPAEGDAVQFIVRVKNLGPNTATGVTAHDLLPAGLTAGTPVPPSQGGYNSGTGVWTIGTLAGSAEATLTLNATVDIGTSGTTITNVATFTGANQTDTNPANDADSAAIMVRAADIALTKSVDDPSPAEGATVTFTISATNAGTLDATGVEVTDLLPAGLTYVSDTGAGAYDGGTGVWSLGGMAAAAADTLDITASVDLGSGNATLTNTAFVSAMDQADVVAANDSASAEVTVVQVVGLVQQAGFVPAAFDLSAPRPNPSGNTTQIRFDLPRAVDVNLSVFDVTGRRINTLIDDSVSAGRFEATWDGRDQDGHAVAAGVYFLRLSAGEFGGVRKVVRVDRS